MISTFQLTNTIAGLPSVSEENTHEDVLRIGRENENAKRELETEWSEWLADMYLNGSPAAVTSKVFSLAKEFADKQGGYVLIERRYMMLADLVVLTRDTETN